MPTQGGTHVAWCYTAQAVPPSGMTQIRALPYLASGEAHPPLQDSRYAPLSPDTPQCGGSNSTAGHANDSGSPVSSGIRARNVAMPWPPRTQLRQVQDQGSKVMRSFQWSGQLTCSKSRDRPGQGFKGQAGSTAEVEVRGTPPSHRGLCVRWEADNPHFSNRVSHLHH